MAASEETLGEQHPYTLRFTRDLALAMQGRRRTQDAEQLHRKVLQIELDTLGDKHPQTLRSRDSLGCLLRATGAQRKYTRIELNHIEYHSIIFVHIEALHWPPTNSNNVNHA